MCFDADASPPIPDNGVTFEARDMTLTAADGNEFSAFEARGSETTAGVVVLPDVRGLFGFYKDLAKCFAQAGHAAVAIDYFGRTEGTGVRDDEFDFWPHVEQVTHEGLKADVETAIAQLRAVDETMPLFTIGFCFGGSNSWHQAANGLGLTGAIGFYGGPTRPDRPLGAPAVVDRVADMEGAILALMAGDDPSITAEDRQAFETALSGAGIDHDIVVYPDAPHSFFDRAYADHADESTDAWGRILAFIGEHSGSPVR